MPRLGLLEPLHPKILDNHDVGDCGAIPRVWRRINCEPRAHPKLGTTESGYRLLKDWIMLCISRVCFALIGYHQQRGSEIKEFSHISGSCKVQIFETDPRGGPTSANFRPQLHFFLCPLKYLTMQMLDDVSPDPHFLSSVASYGCALLHQVCTQ